MRRVLFYSLGGGLGHVTRSLSLAQALARRGVASLVVSNSDRLAAIEIATPPQVQLQSLPADLTADDSHQYFARALQNSYDAVIIDTFPRGIGGELVELLQQENRLKVLISRWLPDDYLKAKDVRRFVRQTYDIVFGPGDESPFGDLPIYRSAKPMLIRDADQLLPPEQARQKLGCRDDDRPIVLFAASGNAVEIDWLEQIVVGSMNQMRQQGRAGEFNFRFAAAGKLNRIQALCRIRHWPLLELFPAVDLVVGAAGYHLDCETRACGVDRLLIPRARKYDCQFHRGDHLRSDFDPSDSGSVVQAVVRAIHQKLDSPTISPKASPAFTSGAHTVAQQLVDQLINN